MSIRSVVVLLLKIWFITAAVQVQPLAQGLPHAMGAAKKKKKCLFPFKVGTKINNSIIIPSPRLVYHGVVKKQF